MTGIWHGRAGAARLDPPVTTQAELSAHQLGADGRGFGIFDHMLEPGRLMSMLDLQLGDPLEVEGRRAVTATATPCAGMQFPRTPPASLWQSVAIDGDVDRVDLVIDLEAGFLLALTTWAGNQVVREVTMQSVSVGGPTPT